MAPLLASTTALLGGIAGALALVALVVSLLVARRRRRYAFWPAGETAPPPVRPGAPSSAELGNRLRGLDRPAPAPVPPTPVPPTPDAAAPAPTIAPPRAASDEVIDLTTPPAAPAAPAAPTVDHQIARAAAAAERAVDLLRGFRASVPAPLSADLAVAMEATVSAWLVDDRITATDVVALLHPAGPGPHAVTAGIASALRHLLVADEAPAWDVACEAAGHLGVSVPDGTALPGPAAATPSPGPLAQEVAAALLVGDAPALGRAAGPAGRLLLSVWPARSWRLDRLPLVVSPSLAAIEPPAGEAPTDRDLALTLLAAVEDAARRQLRVEQALAALQRRYLDEWAASPPEGGDGERHRTAMAATFVTHPVLHLGHVAAILGADLEPAASLALLDDAERRGWVRAVEVPGGPRHWLAVEVVRTAWAVLSRPAPPEAVVDLRTPAEVADVVAVAADPRP